MKKLTLKITTVFALLFILYSLIFSITTNKVVFRTVNEETQANMVETVTTLRSHFRLLTADDLMRKSQKWDLTTGEIANSVNPNERVVIYNKNQEFMYAYGNSKLVTVNPTQESFAQASEHGQYTEVIENDDNRVIYSYIEKIYNSKNELIGYLQISRFISDISHVQQRLTLFTLIGAIIFIAIIFIVLFLYFRRLSLPIEAIKQQVHHISAGKYDLTYEPVNLSEFDEIGENMNYLSHNLYHQQAQLSMQDERLKLMVESRVIGMFLIDSEGKIRLANPAAYQILGIKSDVSGFGYETVVKSYKLIRMIERSLNERGNINEEVYLYHPEEVVLDVNVLFIDDHLDSEISDQVIVLIYDITGIRHLEKVRTDFIANASHELKTPVTALQGFSEALLDGAIDDKDTALEFVKIMNKESKRLNQLISDILDLAKIEQDQMTHHIEVVNLDSLVEEVIQQVHLKAEEKDIQIHKVSGAAGPIIFKSEKGQVSQVVTNLIINAINYTNPQGEVTITINESTSNVEIIVTDNGVGIPEEDLPRIFERFYRVSKSRSTSSGGTGLGLAIVRNIIQSLNGHIDVTSTFGEGSTFRVLLPKNE